jgi:hypothetical protein
MTEPAIARLPFCAAAASARFACSPTTIAAANNQTLDNARLFMMISLEKQTGPCVVRISKTHDSRARERWRHEPVERAATPCDNRSVVPAVYLEGALSMLRHISIIILATALVAGLARTPALAAADGTTNGKTCRMEQQCRWENFKKICTWTKVCR